MKRVTALLLAALLLLSLLPVFASAEGTEPADKEAENKEAEDKETELKEEEKAKGLTAEEVIYAVLSAEGKQEKVLPVVVLDSDRDTEYKYYGDFKSVTNLSSTEKIELKNGTAELKLPKGRFYFESELTKARLPWKIDIEYKLDGKKISADKLGGKNGALEIDISVKADEKADKSFFDAYLVQMSVTLNSDKCRNIEAEGATMANAGASRMINFMSMPGSESEFKLTADVENFSMDGISIAAVPVSMADMLGSINGITEEVDEVTGALDELSEGVNKLNQGALQLNNGVWQFSNGLQELSGGSQGLRDGAAGIIEGLKKAEEMLNSIDNGSIDLSQYDLGVVPAKLNEIADGIIATAAALGTAQTNINNAIAAMDTALSAGTDGINEEGLAYIENVKAAWGGASAQLTAAAGILTTTTDELTQKAGLIKIVAATISGMINDNGQQGVTLDQYVAQMRAMISGMEQFSDGVIQYTYGVDKLASGSVDLAYGTNSLAYGTSELNEGTSGIPEELDKMLEEFENVDFENHSFLSEKNKDVSSVQFVFSTDGIKAPDEKQEEPEETDSKTGLPLIVSRFIDLFRKES